MIIEIKLPFEVESKELDAIFKDKAKFYISNSVMPNNSQLIENYIKTNYNLSSPLRNVLIDIINSLSTIKEDTNYKLILNPIDKLDKIASLVTFGNIGIRGSSILIKAFEYAKAQL